MVFLMPIPPKPPWHAMTTTAHKPPSTVVPSRNSLIESPTDIPATDKIEYNINNNNDCPDDDNNNNSDVDCFPRQDKQPVQPQDISPNDTLPSLIESTTDTFLDTTNYDDDGTVIHDTRYYDNDDNDDDDDDDDTLNDEYGKYDYNDEYDDDDDNSYASSSSEDNDFYYNTPNVIIDMNGNKFIIDNNNDVALYDDDDNNDVDKPMIIQAAQRQINAILTRYHTASSIKESSNCAAAHTTAFLNPMYHPASHITPIASPNDSVQQQQQQQQQQYQHTTLNHSWQ